MASTHLREGTANTAAMTRSCSVLAGPCLPFPSFQPRPSALLTAHIRGAAKPIGFAIALGRDVRIKDACESWDLGLLEVSRAGQDSFGQGGLNQRFL